MTLESLAIIALATWRLSYMLVAERGPFRLFAYLRSFVGVYYFETDKQQPWGMEHIKSVMAKNEVGELFTCVYCLSVWVAPAMFALWEGSALGQVVVVWLAVSGAALMVHNVVRFGRD